VSSIGEITVKTPSFIDISIPDIAPFLPVGMGLALKGINKGNILTNLRKEEFLFRKSYHDVRGRLIFAVASLIFIFFLSLFDLYYHIRIKEERFNSLSSQVRSIFMETFPDVKTIVNEVQQMKGKIKENNDKLQGFGGVVGVQLSSLELLRELSLRIPEQIKIDITEMMITQENIRINGCTDSFDSVDVIRKGLEDSIYFKEVKITDTKAKANEEKVDFKASISLTGGV
jgi:Tfp pilus assembly protein PilN